MTNEQVMQSKSDFVMNELTDCLRAADYGISRLEYSVEQGEEIVTIHYAGGGKKRVCVSMDSKMAIIEDVMKRIW